jgi:hypothetical protein
MEEASIHVGRPSAFRLKNPLPLDVALSFGRCITSLKSSRCSTQRQNKQGQDEGPCGKAEFMRISGAFSGDRSFDTVKPLSVMYTRNADGSGIGILCGKWNRPKSTCCHSTIYTLVCWI